MEKTNEQISIPQNIATVSASPSPSPSSTALWTQSEAILAFFLCHPQCLLEFYRKPNNRVCHYWLYSCLRSNGLQDSMQYFHTRVATYHLEKHTILLRFIWDCGCVTDLFFLSIIYA